VALILSGGLTVAMFVYLFLHVLATQQEVNQLMSALDREEAEVNRKMIDLDRIWEPQRADAPNGTPTSKKFLAEMASPDSELYPLYRYLRLAEQPLWFIGGALIGLGLVCCGIFLPNWSRLCRAHAVVLFMGGIGLFLALPVDKWAFLNVTVGWALVTAVAGALLGWALVRSRAQSGQ
jgi:hypothetical protein